ncbi:MAG: aminoacyl-tRNA hydrolase [Rhizobacter sp.]|nr:aminoacyl-tRNA hydrolase [Chlorobiales bacterium]
MKLLVGLGNPEQTYFGTRHNIGFDVLDVVAFRLQTAFGAGKGDFFLAKTKYKGEDVLLQKPTTYMNLSGRAVRDAMQFYKISILDTLVICDDLNLALGAIRLRASGSDGGHNGLKSIIYETGKDLFPRLRFGIGNNYPKGAQADFVLSKFTASETPVVTEGVQHAADAALSFIEHGLSITMTRFNRAQPSG